MHARAMKGERFGLQFLDGFADFEGRGGGRQRFAEANRDGIRDALRQFPQKTPALVAEDAAPDAVQVNRNDRRADAIFFRAFHDAFHAAAEGKQLADAGDLALVEDADDFALADGVTGFAQGMNHVARTELRGNGNRANHFCEGLDVWLVVDVFEYQEPHGP